MRDASTSSLGFNGDSMELPWHFRGTSTWDFCGRTVLLWGFPSGEVAHGASIVFRCDVRGNTFLSSGLPWEHHGASMYVGTFIMLPWEFRGASMVPPWCLHVVPPWCRHGASMGPSWCFLPWRFHGAFSFHGASMELPWVFHGASMMFFLQCDFMV